MLAENHHLLSPTFDAPSKYAPRPYCLQCTRKCNNHHQVWARRTATNLRLNFHNIWGFTFCIQLVWWDEFLSRKEWTTQIQPGWRYIYTRQLETPGRFHRYQIQLCRRIQLLSRWPTAVGLKRNRVTSNARPHLRRSDTSNWKATRTQWLIERFLFRASHVMNRSRRV